MHRVLLTKSLIQPIFLLAVLTLCLICAPLETAVAQTLPDIPPTLPAALAPFSAEQMGQALITRSAPSGCLSYVSTAVAPEIAALAQNLKNDPDLIFEYVYDQITTLPQMGSLKGPLGALIDQSGTPFDEAELLAQLLVEAQKNNSAISGVSIQVGAIAIGQPLINDWLGTDSNPNSVNKALDAGGIFYSAVSTNSGQVDGIQLISWPWVQVSINGTPYVFDPSTKDYTRKKGWGAAALASAMGYSHGSYYGAVTGGATIQTVPSLSGNQGVPPYVENLNRDAARNSLQGYANQLLATLEENNNSGYGPQDILGGASIIKLPYGGGVLPTGTYLSQTVIYSSEVSATSATPLPLRQTSLPNIVPGPVSSYQYSASSPSTLSSNYRTTLTVSLPGAACYTLNSSDIYGHRLAVQVSAGQPSLTLDSNVLVTGGGSTATANPSCANLSTTPQTLSNGSGFALIGFCVNSLNQNKNGYFTASIPIPTAPNIAYYLIGNTWGPMSRAMLERHRTALLVNKAATPNAPASDPVLGESLSVIADTYLAQISQAFKVVDQIAGTAASINFCVGIVGYSSTQGLYVDWRELELNVAQLNRGANYFGNSPPTPVLVTPLEQSVAAADSLIGSAFESGTLEQTQGPNFPAVSTVSLMDQWSTSGKKIWDIFNAAAYTALANENVPLFQAYPSAALSSFETSFSQNTSYGAAGPRIIAPDCGAIAPGEFDNSCPSKDSTQKFYVYFIMGQDCYTIQSSGLCNAGIGSMIGSGSVIQGSNGGDQYGIAEPDETVDEETSSTDGLNVNGSTTATTIGAIGGGDSGSQGNFADPLNRVTGNFLYSHDDLTLGGGSFPYGLSFQTSYDSGSYLRNGSGFGLGWTHNFAITATPDSDGFEGMAATSPLSGAAAIAAMVVIQDLLNNTSSPPSDALPLANLIMASQAAQWMMEQLTNNVVAVTQPGLSERFIKLTLPNGPTFIPPLKSTSTLNQNGNTYTYTTKEGVVLTFNSACFPAAPTTPIPSCSILTWQHPAGPSVAFSYDSTGTVLQSVTSSFGHSLTITHPSSQQIQVTDENKRKVTYNLDGSSNLTSFTDADGYITNFGYNQLNPSSSTIVPGLLTAITYPTSTSPFLKNTYDQWGRVQTQTDANSHQSNFYIAGSRTELDDPRNNETVYYFDQLGNLTASIDNAGHETGYSYDGLSRLTQKTLPESNSMSFTYDTNYATRFNRLVFTNNPKSGSQQSLSTRSYQYESHNKVKQFTNEKGIGYYFQYDGQGNLTDICQPNDSTCAQNHQKFAYADGTGLPTTATDAYLKNTYYAHVGGQVSEVIESGGAGNYTTNYCYDGVGNLIGIVDANTNANTAFSQCPTTSSSPGPVGTFSTSFFYDSDRLLQYRFDAASTGSGTKYQYDQKGNLNYVYHQECSTGAVSCACPVNSAACTWQQIYHYLYSPSFKLQQSTDWGGTTVYTYDFADNLQTVTDPETRVTTYLSDYLNRPSSVTSNLYSSPIAQYSYTPNGKVQTLTDANQRVTQYSYDGFDRLAWTQFPDNSVEYNGLIVNGAFQNGYDPVGNLQSKTLRNGGTIGYKYDSLNRVQYKSPSNQNVITYNYDLVGRLTSLLDGSAVYGFNFNNATGRLQTTTTPTGLTVGYQFDPNGNRTQLSYPNGYIAFYQFDALNRLSKVTDSSDGLAFSNPLVTYQYFNDSRRASLIYRNGNSTDYSYAAYGPSDLNKITHNFMVSSSTSITGSATFTYNYDSQNVHQWNSRVITGASAFEYSFMTPSGSSVTTSYSPNSVNQYVSSCTNGAGCYSGGNMTTDPAGNSYVYNTENRMVEAYTSAHSAAYTYDPKGRRVSKTVDASSPTTIFLWDGKREIAEYNGSLTPQVLYVYGADLDEAILTVNLSSSGNTANFNHLDGTGSVVAQSNGGDGTISNPGTGYVGDIYSYGPYGETNSVTGNAFRYTGRRLDPETGLYYYRARMYSPTLGRFLQNDPAGYSGGLNLYAYVGNDPINHTDPMGTNPTEVASAGSNLIAANDNELTPPPTTSSTTWSPASETMGPLGDPNNPDDVASTFRSGTYTETVLDEDTTFYRAYGGTAAPVGRYLTDVPPQGLLQAQIDSALLPEWGNTVTDVSSLTVPRGTTIYQGFAAPQTSSVGMQPTLMGGGAQIYIPTVDPSWLNP